MKMKTAMMLACFIPLKIPFLGTKEREAVYQVITKYIFAVISRPSIVEFIPPCLMIGYKLGYDFIYNFS